MSVKLISSSSKENCILAMFIALVVAPSLITVCAPTLLSALFLVGRGVGGTQSLALVVAAYVMHTHTRTVARISDSRSDFCLQIVENAVINLNVPANFIKELDSVQKKRRCH